ncbi:MAG: hypothetical protein V4639_15145 [Pseudomonadota bacterium]
MSDRYAADDGQALEARRQQLQEQLQEGACTCSPELLEVRRRTFGNGSKHYVLQCGQCGQQRGNALKTKEAQERLSGASALEFDPSIEIAYAAQRSVLLEECAALWRQAAVQRDPEWMALIEADRAEEKARAERVLALVEACAAAVASEVGEEKAADVLALKAIALRRVLRDTRLQATKRFGSEVELKTWLMAHLSEDFNLYAEVPGRHVAEGVRVQIDYLAYPKRHLLDAGFIPAHFGIEVKHLDQTQGFSHKAARGLWQTVSYTDSEFFLEGAAIRPKFALLFSNISFEEEHRLLNRLGQELENDRALWVGLLQLANHANVGTLEIMGSRDAWMGWKMAFSGGMYFWRRHHEGERRYLVSNSRTIEKVRIGNF